MATEPAYILPLCKKRWHRASTPIFSRNHDIDDIWHHTCKNPKIIKMVHISVGTVNLNTQPEHFPLQQLLIRPCHYRGFPPKSFVVHQLDRDILNPIEWGHVWKRSGVVKRCVPNLVENAEICAKRVLMHICLSHMVICIFSIDLMIVDKKNRKSWRVKSFQANVSGEFGNSFFILFVRGRAGGPLSWGFLF